MGRWNDPVDEEIAMTPDIERAFRDLGKSVDQNGKDTREKISEIHRAMDRHSSDDRVFQEKVGHHLEEHERTRKWRIALWIGAIGSLIAALAEAVAHHFIK